MKIVEFFRSRLQGAPAVTPVERTLAKRWVKERLKRMFPELRHDPRALEEAYQNLSLEPVEGAGKGGETLFEVVLPGRLD
jgi:hypothetical protein